MKTEDVKHMKAGRELDALVAERVMGWKRGPGKYEGEFWHKSIEGHGDGWQTRDVSVWSPSTDIAAAWEVAEKLEIGVLPWEENGVKGFVAGFERDGASVSWFEAVLYEWPADASWTFAETAPLAICRAALRVEVIQSSHA